MTEERSRILLFAGLGYQQQSLVTLLQSMPEVDLIVIYKIASVSKLANGFSPDVVLIDASIPDVGRELIRNDVKGHWPGAQCVLLADCPPTSSAKTSTYDALDGVICKGNSVSKLIKQIERVIHRKRSPGEGNSLPDSGIS